MTGEKTYLEDLKSYFNSYVSFGDKETGRIKAIGKKISLGLPCFNDVLLVEGLTANFISIIQLCDQYLNVNFSKSECIITNKDQEVLMKRLRSKDKCYKWISHPSSCMLSKVDETKLCHKDLDT